MFPIWQNDPIVQMGRSHQLVEHKQSFMLILPHQTGSKGPEFLFVRIRSTWTLEVFRGCQGLNYWTKNLWFFTMVMFEVLGTMK